MLFFSITLTTFLSCHALLHFWLFIFAAVQGYDRTQNCCSVISLPKEKIIHSRHRGERSFARDWELWHFATWWSYS